MKKFLLSLAILLTLSASISAQVAYGPPWGPTSPQPSSPEAPVALDPPVGTILVSRYTDERLNRSPGFQNHLAMYVGNGWVVESVSPIGVRYVALQEYLARPGKTRDRVYFKSQAAANKAACRVVSMVGCGYRKISSIFLFPRADWRGVNCTSLIRAGASAGYGQNILIQIPDDVYKYPQYFTRNLQEIGP